MNLAVWRKYLRCILSLQEDLASADGLPTELLFLHWAHATSLQLLTQIDEFLS
jgi:hypothetical protein